METGMGLHALQRFRAALPPRIRYQLLAVADIDPTSWK